MIIWRGIFSKCCLAAHSGIKGSFSFFCDQRSWPYGAQSAVDFGQFKIDRHLKRYIKVRENYNRKIAFLFRGRGVYQKKRRNYVGILKQKLGKGKYLIFSKMMYWKTPLYCGRAAALTCENCQLHYEMHSIVDMIIIIHRKSIWLFFFNNKNNHLQWFGNRLQILEYGLFRISCWKTIFCFGVREYLHGTIIALLLCLQFRWQFIGWWLRLHTFRNTNLNLS